ncbi:pyocin knob domain-containing protein, partial [Citrobacter koseri]|uniref:pyocin knob domain-containing protein n=1 Tax=Citrobacter koseri TaxID=545 RepID=UPI001F1CCECB
MFHLDNNSGISSMPAPAAQQSSATRWFTEGGGTDSPSWPGQDWFNIVQAELLNVLTAAGIAPKKAQFNQLALAIKAIVNKDALLKANHLSEIKDAGAAAQKSSRENLGLKSAAIADVVASITDLTSGRVPLVGWMGLGGAAINISAGNLNSLPTPTYSSIKRYSPEGSSFFAGVSAFCYVDGDGRTNFAEIMAPVTGSAYPFVRNKDGMQLIFTNKNPPKASDVGAFPLVGALNVDLNTLGADSHAGVYVQRMTANATTANHYPINEAGWLNVTQSAYGSQQEYTTFGSNRKFVRGLTGQWNGNNGPWGGWKEYFQTAGGQMLGAIRGSMDGAGSYASQNDANVLAPFFQQINDAAESKFFPIIKQRYAQGNGTWSLGTIIKDGSFVLYYISGSDSVGKTFRFGKDGVFNPGSFSNFDARYQAKGSYTPAGEAYTKAQSDARYVQNIRVSATQVREFRDGGGYSSNDAAFATAIAMVGGSSNVGSLLVRYVQKL